MDSSIALFVSLFSVAVGFITLGTLIFKAGAWTGDVNGLKKSHSDLEKDVSEGAKIREEKLTIAYNSLDSKLSSAAKALEDKLTLAIASEVKRNDEITSLIAGNTKELAQDQKLLVQRMTAVETILTLTARDFEDLWPRLREVERLCTKNLTVCDECSGRPHCGEDDKNGEKDTN